jgi:hypothetical protein
MSKDFGIPPTLFHAKQIEFRRKHEKVHKTEELWLSDEQPENEELSNEIVDMFNKKILGFKQDYIDETEDITTEGNKKEKPGNAQNLETPIIDTPLDFSKIKFSELFRQDCEHFFMDFEKVSESDCQTCKLVFDYTQICQHQDFEKISSADTFTKLKDELSKQATV